METKFTKEEKSWILYDWANSSYATTMLAAIFPVFFVSVCSAGGVDGDLWWSIGSSIGTALIAFTAPLLGAVADYRGMKKKLLSAFLFIGLGFTLMCAIVDSWQLLLVGYIFSYVGFAGANLFYDSFLTDVTTNERMDKVSAWGFSMGYIGGSTIPFIVSIGLITFGSNFGIDGTMAVKIAIVITVVWWAVFSLPILKNCEQKHGVDIPTNQLVKSTFSHLLATMKELLSSKAVLMFTIAYFFYIDGVNTVIKMSTAYGATLGLDSTGMILALLVTQIVAFPCAILFGKMASKFGSINMLIGSVAVYFFICILGFIMGFGLEEEFLTVDQSLMIFWVLAFLVGTVQGGIQALSRSYFGKLIPPEKAGEYFGVFDIFGKFAAIMGPAIYAFVRGITGRSSLSILAIILLFAIGGAVLIANKKMFIEFEANKHSESK